MTDPFGDQDDAATPLSEEEKQGLIPSYVILRCGMPTGMILQHYWNLSDHSAFTSESFWREFVSTHKATGVRPYILQFSQIARRLC